MELREPTAMDLIALWTLSYGVGSVCGWNGIDFGTTVLVWLAATVLYLLLIGRQ